MHDITVSLTYLFLLFTTEATWEIATRDTVKQKPFKLNDSSYHVSLFQYNQLQLPPHLGEHLPRREGLVASKPWGQRLTEEAYQEVRVVGRRKAM
jgi:hypothetical protein